MTDEELTRKIAEAIWHAGGMAEDQDDCDLEIDDIGDDEVLWRSARAVATALDLPSVKAAARAEALEEAASHLEQVADFIFERLRMGRSVHQVEGQSIHDLKREASAIRALAKSHK
jgi:hypothetical protein